MKKAHKYPMHSIQKDARLLLFILVFVLIINILISCFASSMASSQSRRHTDEIMDIYLNTLENQTESIERFVAWTVQHEDALTDIGTVDKLTTDLSVLRNRIADFQFTISQNLGFFLYVENADFFTNCSPLLVSYKDYLELKSYYQNLIQNKERSLRNWNVLEINGTYYLYHLITVDNRSFICQMSLEDLVAPLKNMELGKRGYLDISTGDHEFYIMNDQILTQAPDVPLSSRFLVYHSQNARLPVSIRIYMDRFSAFQKIILLQITVIATAIVLILLLGLVLFFTHRRVLQPIQEFCSNLTSINTGTDFLNLQSSNIIELEQANEQFKNLMREIKKLKINIYENELEKKRIQIDFMKLQIRPHFYLNCLTCIYSMAQTQLYEEIEQMALSTAKYLRYLLQNDQDFVSLHQEVSHVEDYLSIQKLRYGDVFTYLCEIEPDMEDTYIPPLVLQTFIENTIKHAVSPDEVIQIHLVVKKTSDDHSDFLQIRISNTGTGFPEDVISVLNSGQLLKQENGTHIGITNIIQRLQLLYDGNFSIHFDNLSAGGALVTLTLPFHSMQTEVLP